jgi:hypothetical protein
MFDFCVINLQQKYGQKTTHQVCEKDNIAGEFGHVKL